MAKIAWVGLGNMGTPMAINLVKAGHDVTVWNRSISKAEPVKAAGGKVAASAAADARAATCATTCACRNITTVDCDGAAVAAVAGAGATVTADGSVGDVACYVELTHLRARVLRPDGQAVGALYLDARRSRERRVVAEDEVDRAGDRDSICDCSVGGYIVPFAVCHR